MKFDNLFLLIGVFKPFMFNMVNDLIRVKCIILLFVHLIFVLFPFALYVPFMCAINLTIHFFNC